MTLGNLKLGVDVVGAHNILPKDGKGSSSAFVELCFDGQRYRSTVKEKDLNPVWNETFYFNITDPSILQSLILDAYVYDNVKAIQSRAFLGQVSINGTSFVPYSDAVVLHYPLEKRGIFSRVQGELGLKVYITDDPSIKSSVPVSVADETHLPSESSVEPVDFALKETSPFLVGERDIFDLVEKMHFLFVRVVKARELPAMDVTGSLDPFVEVRIGNYKIITKHIEKQQNPVWNVVFAFARERMQASVLEVVVKDKDLMNGDFVGLVQFDLNEIPLRVPPVSPLAPEWYRLEDNKGEKIKGELMLAVWIGTQEDEAFPDALSPTPIDSSAAASALIRSKVYHAPRLWYVCVNVVEAQDLVPTERNRLPDCYVKAHIGNQVMRTKPAQARNFNPVWNEDLFFVAAEPFEDHLILTVEDRVAPGKDEIIGRVIIPLNMVEKCADDRIIHSRWFNLEKPVLVDADQLKKEKFSSRLHLRVCLDGGYHVLDESTHYRSDLRPTAKQLWKPPIGVLELGILNAVGLHPIKTRDGKGTSDTYCVAKYGDKWVRTRTIVDNLFPKFNEHYTWEVFDPATVLTVGVLDNSQLGENGSNGNKDVKIGKVRVRISTLETDRIYIHSYPLLVFHPNGVRKMGELHLALRFTCTSFANMLYIYSKPLLPKMHYIRPFSVMQLDMLRDQAVNVVAMRLGRAEPPLRKEVVEYMSDVDSHLWSMRRSKANFFRLILFFSGLLAVGRLFGLICMWKSPVISVFVHVVYLMLVSFPELILPTAFLCMFLRGIWNYRYRPRYPLEMDTQLSHAEAVHLDELYEEFFTYEEFSTLPKNLDLVTMSYDRLRSVAGRIQTVVGDIASQVERVQSLLSWRDPRATAIFITFCLVAAVVLYVTPFQVIAALAGIYMMRHPRFRYRVPSVPINFRRLPARTDSML